MLARKRAGGLDAAITAYPGQAHGFSLRGQQGDAKVREASDTAFKAGLEFLDKHLA